MKEKKGDKSLDNISEVIEIRQNTTITYNDNQVESYDAIYLTDKGVVFGRTLNDDNTEFFIGFGYIPMGSIKSINFGKKKKIKRFNIF